MDSHHDQPENQYLNADPEEQHETIDNETENEYATINDINTFTEINAANINVNPETEEENHDRAFVEGNMATHGYNLNPRPLSHGSNSAYCRLAKNQPMWNTHATCIHHDDTNECQSRNRKNWAEGK